MNTYICRGRRKPLATRGHLVTLEVNGVSFAFTSAATCHDAAYRATELALRAARRSGATRVWIRTSPLVANQMSGVWRTRKARMRARRAACVRAAGAMEVRYA